ncbi:MAG: hypothetical protein K2W94_02565 [Alphaproteobacteria bacterium]|nr:hypothetical protein [Alphaproteobacteria bacterium]
MKKYILLSFVLLIAAICSNPTCHASDTQESKKTSHKFNAEQIIQEIQASEEDTYSAPGIFIMDSLGKELKHKNEKIITKFKEKIEAVNSAFKESDEWEFAYFPEEDKVNASLAKGK